ncbi:MAG TPA: hypothetical protein VI542_26000 [Candidatus Tectomicrobia bacterium]
MIRRKRKPPDTRATGIEALTAPVGRYLSSAPRRGMATIRWKMGRFGVTVSFHVEFKKTTYRQTGYWPKTDIFGHAYE